MQELEKILKEIDKISVDDIGVGVDCNLQGRSDLPCDNCYECIKDACKDIIRKHMNDGWIPVEERLPGEPGKYWATIRKSNGTITEPIITDFRGAKNKYVVNTPDGREYETWGIDTAFYGSRVIARKPYYAPEPYNTGNKDI